MKPRIFFTSLLALILLLSACRRDDPLREDWLIPVEQVQDGGPGKDGIPSVDNPQFDLASAVTYLNDEDLVLGIQVGDEIRAYPHPVLDWHEIVNDQVGDLAVAITYCPLTGTGIGWSRNVNGARTTFGVSGLLYNSNLIPYDRATDSNWSQMRLECVNGDLSGSRPELIPLVETTWGTWKKMFPNAQVMTTNTGFSRSYGQYPYGDFRTSSRLIFPVQPMDGRLPTKERVLGIVADEDAKVYRFSTFDYGPNGRALIRDTYAGQDYWVVASEDENFIIAFRAGSKNLSLVEGVGTALLQDEDGNQYNCFGQVISDGTGVEALELSPAFIGYWFSWGAFYPGVNIYE
ncbi:MAG: DUF3179 domain-containing protein [Bacteroidota bacterium]